MKIDLSSAEDLMQEAVARRIFPGAVLWVWQQGALVLHRAYGMADLFAGRSMTIDTVFDLASLTKPLATALAAMLLVQQGRLGLDRRCRDYYPPFSGGGRDAVTIRHLLSHRSGLPDWRPFYLHGTADREADGTAVLRRAVMAEPLEAAPGERALYSDLGFMVLQWVIEEVAGEPLDRFLQKALYGLLDGDAPFFIARSRGAPRRPYAATELCPLRGRLLIGEVHDDNAHLAGGIAGHAGLFATAQAVGVLLRHLLSAYHGALNHSHFEAKWVRLFFERQDGGDWALGFDTPSAPSSSSGQYFSSRSVGHLGYTGTSFWMECQRSIIVVLLTNRVHPSRYNDRIKAFRPRLHDALMSALIAAGSGRG